MNPKTLLLFLTLNLSCTPEKSPKNCTEDPDLPGVLYAEYPAADLENLPFTKDNRIYRGGNTYRFAFTYQSPTGEDLSFAFAEKAEKGKFPWTFKKKTPDCPDCIVAVEMQVKPTDKVKYQSGYHQTDICYTYLTRTGALNYPAQNTGLIENDCNVWLHPPRSGLFRVLELNPFPHIKKPYEVGHSFESALKIGSHWQDERWREWEGSITNQTTYRIFENAVLHVAGSDISCLITEAKAGSELGNTYLKTWFNDTIGFVKYEYTNIDGSKIMLELDSFFIYESRPPQKKAQAKDLAIQKTETQIKKIFGANQPNNPACSLAEKPTELTDFMLKKARQLKDTLPAKQQAIVYVKHKDRSFKIENGALSVFSKKPFPDHIEDRFNRKFSCRKYDYWESLYPGYTETFVKPYFCEGLTFVVFAVAF